MTARATNRTLWRVAAVALFLAAALAPPAAAQVQEGRIVGTVRDPQRAVIPKARSPWWRRPPACPSTSPPTNTAATW